MNNQTVQQSRSAYGDKARSIQAARGESYSLFKYSDECVKQRVSVSGAFHAITLSTIVLLIEF